MLRITVTQPGDAAVEGVIDTYVEFLDLHKDEVGDNRSARSRLNRATYVLLTISKASRYRSIHLERHVSSELVNDIPGFVIHFWKHFSLALFISS